MFCLTNEKNYIDPTHCLDVEAIYAISWLLDRKTDRELEQQEITVKSRKLISNRVRMAKLTFDC